MEIPRIDFRSLEGAIDFAEPETFRVYSDEQVWRSVLSPPTAASSLSAIQAYLTEMHAPSIRPADEAGMYGIKLLREGIAATAPANVEGHRPARSAILNSPPLLVQTLLRLARVEPFAPQGYWRWPLYIAVRNNTQVLMPVMTYGWQAPRKHIARLFEVSPSEGQLYIGDGRMVSQAANIARVPGVLEACLQDFINVQKETPR